MEIQLSRTWYGLSLLLAMMLMPGVSWSLATPKNVCINSGAGTACENSNASVKWHPGHYALGRYGKLSSNPNFRKIINNKYFQGIVVPIDWADLEPTKGVYDFSLLEENLRYAESKGKRIIIYLKYKTFHKTARSMKCAPKDLVQSGGAIFGDAQMGSERFAARCMALIWRPDVKERLVALLRKVGKKFDKEPFVEAIEFQETAGSGATAKGYPGHDAYYRALVDIVRDAKQAFPSTNILQMTNHIVVDKKVETPAERMAKLFAEFRKVGAGVSGPDLVAGRSMTSYPLFAKHAGQMPLAIENQRASQFLKNWGQTAEKAYNFAVDDPKGLHVNYLIWALHNTAPEINSDAVFRVVARNRGRINSSCPANIQCKP